MNAAKFQTVLLSLLLGVAGMPAGAQEMAPNTGWEDAGVTLLDVNFGASGFHSRWELFQCACGDTLVRLEQTAPDGVLTGELLLIDGQVLAARGLVAEAGDLELMLQAPMLMAQLSFGLLQRSIPGGPAAVAIDRDIDVTEKTIDIELNTGLANGRFGAPWRVTGRAWRGGPLKRRFRLNFEFTNPDPAAPEPVGALTLEGGQDFGPEAYPLHDATPLDGWRIQWVSKGETQPSMPEPGLTIGALRAQALKLSQPKA